MLAGVNLLSDVKKVAGERFGDNDFLEESGLADSITYARTTYIASALLVDNKQLIKIIDACKAGEPAPAELLAPYFAGKDEHEKSWQEYVASNHDFSSEAMLIRVQA